MSGNPMAEVLNNLMKSPSTSAFSNFRTERNCYEPETSLMLVFNPRQYEPIIKKRVVNLWKALQSLAQTTPNYLTTQNVRETSKQGETTTEEIVEDYEELSSTVSTKKRDDGLRKLFEKMLELGMDKHALAIADGYRTRPQVCTCEEDCCQCFDYSQFLHKLKLHNHKELLRKVYAENSKREDSLSPEEIQQSSSGGQSKTSLRIREDKNDEFSMKMEKSEADFDNDPIKTSVIARIRREICSEAERVAENTSEKKLKKQKNERSAKVTRRHCPKRVDPEPPYETKFNSVHRRVREFGPDNYKILVREEIKQLNEMPALERELWVNRVRDLATRPPWKI